MKNWRKKAAKRRKKSYKVKFPESNNVIELLKHSIWNFLNYGKN